MRSITIRIKKGAVKVATTGYAGAACLEATRRLQARIGETLSDVQTSEMDDAVQADEQEVAHDFEG